MKIISIILVIYYIFSMEIDGNFRKRAKRAKRAKNKYGILLLKI